MGVFAIPELASRPEDLERIAAALRGYLRLPFAGDSIPGRFVEAVIATMRDATVLNTYDFVDVVKTDDRIGWQVKSTKAATPVTWKRAKIPNALALIRASQKSADGCQALGDAIIEFCNEHVTASMELYDLTAIGYARAITDANQITYFERQLVTREEAQLFDPNDFDWRWSKPKVTKTKEQLPALHGIYRHTGEKWWAWHGLGENQLHFSGEGAWWPAEGEDHQISIAVPDVEDEIPFEDFVEWVTRIGEDVEPEK